MPKTLKISIKKKHKKDRKFILPNLCLYCASPEITYQYQLYNQHTSFINRLLSMMLGIVHLLLSVFQNSEVVCIGYVCEKCESILQQKEKVKKWFWIKWLLLTIIFYLLGILPMAEFFPLPILLPIEYVISVIIIVPIAVMIILRLLQRKKLQTIYNDINSNFHADMLVNNLRVFPVGFAWNKKNARYKLVANVSNLQYIRQFMKLNANESIISYNENTLQKIKQSI